MKRWFLFLLLPVVLIGAEPASSPVLVEARRILANAKSTHYSHRTTVDEAAGQPHFD